MITTLAGILVITALSTPFALSLGIPLALPVLLVVGSVSAIALEKGRHKGTSGVMGGFALGTFLKLIGITVIFVLARRSGIEPGRPLLFTLAVLFAFYVWTSYRFKISSSA